MLAPGECFRQKICSQLTGKLHLTSFGWQNLDTKLGATLPRCGVDCLAMGPSCMMIESGLAVPNTVTICRASEDRIRSVCRARVTLGNGKHSGVVGLQPAYVTFEDVHNSASVDNNEGRNGDSFSSDILGESDHATTAARIFVASLPVVY